MEKQKRSNSDAFTLLEILLALTIIGVIAAFTISIANSIRNRSKVMETKNRMAEIAVKAKDYYRGHEDLPGPTGTNEVPVGTSDLNMEQKFRLDAWGRYFYYNRLQNSEITIDGITFPADTMADIDGLTVDGKSVAGVVISGGPNQTIESISTAPVYTTTADDILVPVDVSQEAMEITLEDLKVLQAKVKAFDALYEGVANDPDADIDEDGCVEQLPYTSCPPTGATNDPNCGTLTLDYIKRPPGFGPWYTGALCSWAGMWTVEPLTDLARHAICELYDLADNYRIDPWLRGYIWGSSVAPNTYPTSNARYHKFFSWGPDGARDTPDDIIP